MLLLLIIMTLTLSTWANEIPPCSNLHCFHQPASECPSLEDEYRCRAIPHCDRAVICCDVTERNVLDELKHAGVGRSRNVAYLHIRNATINKLNLNETTSNWRHLLSLSVTDGHVHTVDGEFGKHTGISCLNLSSNGINVFGNRSLTRLYNLTMLDLSHNNLSHVPRFTKQTNMTLDISGNNVLCVSLNDIRNRSGSLKFNNGNQTYCLASKTFHWFNSTEQLTLTQLQLMHKLEKSCTVKNCTCEHYGFDIIPEQPTTLTISVNCAGQQLTALPVPLPINTISLNVSDNNIEKLDAIHDPSYENLRELFADNNKIDSILPLEGSKFISNFMSLSLRHNKLKAVPTYVLSNVLDRNNAHIISLGKNKLECDCSTAILKVWLQERHEHVPDYMEIWCDNIDSRVIDLDTSKLCQSQYWTDYIYYIITAEVLLLVGLIAKVSYDYWVFKTTGYLPWPASKMPKLPCDWLCE